MGPSGETTSRIVFEGYLAQGSDVFWEIGHGNARPICAAKGFLYQASDGRSSSVQRSSRD